MKRAIPYATKSHGTIQKRWPYVSALSRSATFNVTIYGCRPQIMWNTSLWYSYDIFALPLAWHSSSTSFRKPSIMFNSLIFWSVSQDGFHIYFYFQIWSLWSICFLYKPMWWWGCNKFSKNVFGFLATLLSFELSTWRSTQFRVNYYCFILPGNMVVFFSTFLALDFDTSVCFRGIAVITSKSVSPSKCNEKRCHLVI